MTSAFEGTSPEELAFFAREGAVWVREQRDRHRPEGRALSAEERLSYRGFFEAGLLDSVRVRRLARFENPGFFRLFEEAGQPLPMDLRNASGLALIDTVLISTRISPGSPAWLSVLFHELVHVAQDRELGPERYMESYVNGWAEHGFEYRAIPQEAQAYRLQERFSRDPGRLFSVSDEVRSAFGRR